MFHGGRRINLARFFRITGVVLVFVAAGLVATAIHTAHEAGWISFGQTQIADFTWFMPTGSIVSALLTGVLGIQPQPVAIEFVGWLLYLVPMLLIVLWPAAQRPRQERAKGSCRDSRFNNRRLRRSPFERRRALFAAALVLAVNAACSNGPGVSTAPAICVRPA